MRTTQTLDEARKYLLYVSDALRGIASSYAVDRNEREVLEKYASDIIEYSKGLDKLNIHLTAKEKVKRMSQVTAELESVYEMRKRVASKAAENLRIIKARLKQAEDKGSKREIDEIKMRLAYYTRELTIAQQNESIAKRTLEQGA